MKITINLSSLGPKKTGLGVYSENIIKNLLKSRHVDLIYSEPIFYNETTKYNSPRSICIGTGLKGAIKRIIWSIYFTPPKESIIYSPTHHGLYRTKNQIITIHDLICLSHPKQHFFQYLYFKYLLPLTLKKCIAIFTVSEFTKEEIHKAYGIDKKKIYVVPNGVDQKVFFSTSEQKKTKQLLVVGARYMHKNIQEIIKFNYTWKEEYNLTICSYSEKTKKNLLREAKKHGITEKIFFLNNVSNDKLIELYRQSAALIYPSKIEGFGIPPLESLACGTPAIVSNIPAHNEVLSDSAIYINFDDEKSWRDAFKTLNDPDKIKMKLKMAKKRVYELSWENSAKKLNESLKKVIENQKIH